MTLQAQWSLEKTADSAISISRGLLQAATSDNVQPLAIIACERFGNTLAMCPETCRKVEKTVLPTPPHAVLKFLQGTVGYSPNDCATYFGTSQAGLQFLSFATALINTMDTLESAKQIHHLLVDSASDKCLVPTLLQVEDLIESLGPRCRLLPFTDEVFGWNSLLVNLIRDRDKSFENGSKFFSRFTPSAEALKEIVNAFRELSRIGDSGAVSVTFKTSTFTSWLIAFTKWCLGSPPSTYMEDGAPLMETANSKVRVYTSRTNSLTLEISLDYSIDSPRELTISEDTDFREVFGMVGLRTYCKWLLRELNVDRGSALTAVQSAIAGAVKRAVSNIMFVSIEENSKQWGEELETNTTRKYPHLMLQPLREASHVLSLMFEEYDSWNFASDHFSVLQIPAVRAHCTPPQVEPGTADLEADDSVTSEEMSFLRALANIVKNVLALSLYRNPESLKVFNTGVLTRPKWAPKGTMSLEYSIETALTDGTKSCCPAHLLLDQTMQLVGHFKGRTAADLPVVMSSFSGQTVYFDFLETNTVFESGFTSLSWLPGLIWHGADKHHLVQSGQSPSGTYRSKKTIPVQEPRNLVQGAFLKWRVGHDGRQNGLRLTLTTDGHEDSSDRTYTGVGGVLSSLLESVILETCPHDRNSCIDGRLAKRCRYHIPGQFIPGHHSEASADDDDSKKTHIVAVDGDDALRFYACAHLGGKAAVFRGDACLNCCVEVCIEAGLSFVIL